MTNPPGGESEAPGAVPPAAELERLRLGAERAAEIAAAEILAVAKRGDIRFRHKGDDGPVTEADHAADAALHRDLTALLPGSQWVSEESMQAAPIRSDGPTWVVDPLDGTREFIRGLPEYGVSIGLFLGGQLVLGVVAIPPTGELLSGVTVGQGRGGWRNGAPMPVLDRTRAVGRVVVSRWDYEHRGIDDALPFETYPCGSAAVKLAHVAVGQAGAYLSTGPRSVWDVAGGVGVLEGIGGQFVTIDGRPLDLDPATVPVPPYIAGSPRGTTDLLQVFRQPPDEVLID